MKALHLAELRASWQAWLSVCLAFVTASFSLALALLAVNSTMHYATDTGMTPVEAASTTGMIWFNVALCIPVAMMVIGSVTQLVIASRRPSIARLALAGATPAQITWILTVQLIVVSVASAVVGCILAIIAQQPVLDMLSSDRSTEGVDSVIPALLAAWPFLIAVAVSVLVAVIGGNRQARRATRIPPVEALRTAAVGEKPTRYVARWIGFVLVFLMSIGLGVGIIVAFPYIEYQKGDIIMQAGMGALLFLLWAISLVAPMILSPLTRLWTGLIPTKSAVWHLVRHNVIAKGDRLAKTVVPMTLAISLPLGIMMLGQSFSDMLVRRGQEGLGHGSLETLVLLVGLPFLIALAGAICNLIMLSRARDAELALDRLAGATPAQARWILVLEGLTMFGSSLVLVVVPLALFAAFIWAGLETAYGEGLVSLPLVESGQLIGGVLLLAVLATTLPSLKSIDQPAPKVIARLIAD